MSDDVQTIKWLRGLAEKGGKGVVNNIDARCLGRIADALERLAGERDEAAKQLADFMDPTLKSMRLENGKFDMQLGGEIVQRTALAMTEWFRESGAKNYVEMTLHAKTEPFERYQVFVQKQGDGAKTPHQLRMDAEARALAAETSIMPKSVLDRVRHLAQVCCDEDVLRWFDVHDGPVAGQPMGSE